jgi:hypothetical protein
MELNWQRPETTPEVEKGSELLFWLAVETKAPITASSIERQKRVHTFLAFYQNRPLDIDDEDCLVGPDGEPHESIGWVLDKQHDYFDSYYMPVEFNDEYKLVGWAEYTPPKFKPFSA